MTIAAKTEQKGKSPYARHQKVPILYSTEYQNWKHAYKTGKPSDVAHWARLHDAKYAPQPGTYEPALMGPLHTEPRQGRYIR